MFENNDELGVDEFTKDFEYMFEDFKILVKHISKQQDKENEYIQGDFLGIRTKTFPDNEKYIYMVLESDNSGKKEEQRDGKTGRGVEEYTGYVRKHNMLNIGDKIRLLQNIDSNFIAGTMFRVEPENKGNFKFNSVFQRVKLIRL
jgi:hypothetical protein